MELPAFHLKVVHLIFVIYSTRSAQSLLKHVIRSLVASGRNVSFTVFSDRLRKPGRAFLRPTPWENLAGPEVVRNILLISSPLYLSFPDYVLCHGDQMSSSLLCQLGTKIRWWLLMAPYCHICVLAAVLSGFLASMRAKHSDSRVKICTKSFGFYRNSHCWHIRVVSILTLTLVFCNEKRDEIDWILIHSCFGDLPLSPCILSDRRMTSEHQIFISHTCFFSGKSMFSYKTSE